MVEKHTFLNQFPARRLKGQAAAGMRRHTRFGTRPVYRNRISSRLFTDSCSEPHFPCDMGMVPKLNSAKESLAVVRTWAGQIQRQLLHFIRGGEFVSRCLAGILRTAFQS